MLEIMPEESTPQDPTLRKCLLLERFPRVRLGHYFTMIYSFLILMLLLYYYHGDLHA